MKKKTMKHGKGDLVCIVVVQPRATLSTDWNMSLKASALPSDSRLNVSACLRFDLSYKRTT